MLVIKIHLRRIVIRFPRPDLCLCGKVLIVLLVKSELIDKLRFGVLASTPVPPPLFGALGLSVRLFPEPCGAAAGDPGTPPPIRRFAPLREATETHGSGSCLVGLVMRGLERLAVLSFPRPTRDRDRLASERLSPVLDLQSSIWQARAPRRVQGDPN